MNERLLDRAKLDRWVEEEKLSPNQADALWRDLKGHEPFAKGKPSVEFLLTVLCLASMGLSLYVMAALFLG